MKKNIFIRFLSISIILLFVIVIWSCKKDENIITNDNVSTQITSLSKWYADQIISPESPSHFAQMNVPDWASTKIVEKGDTVFFTTLIFDNENTTRELHTVFLNKKYTALVRQYDFNSQDSLGVESYTINGKIIDFGYFNKKNEYFTLKTLKGKKFVLVAGETRFGGVIDEVTVTRPGPSTGGWLPGRPSGFPSGPPSTPSYPPAGGFGGGGGSTRMTTGQIRSALINKPFGLLKDVPCDVIQQWVALGKHFASQSQLDKLKSIIGSRVNPSPSNNFTGHEIAKIQLLDAALSTTINMDYYPIKVDKLPTGFYSGDQFLQYLRTNLNSFVDNQYAEFEPYKWYGINDNNLWNSNNPINSIIAIDIQGPDNGSVIVTQSSLDKWTFTTIRELYVIKLNWTLRSISLRRYCCHKFSNFC